MRRYFEDFLLKWKDRSTRKPLIVRGARQVGKTFIIEQFGKKQFKNFLKVNLEENEDARKLFNIKNTKQITDSLSLIYQTKIEPSETLLFIDEIQTSPEAIATLRYFYEQQPDLHVIAAGSLLDHALNEMKYSMPVGRVEFAYMYPMNFREFLWAVGEEQLADFLDSFKIKDYIAEAVHSKLLTLLRRFFFIGGMPEAVKTYIETDDLLEVERIHENILTSLEYDFAKYGTKTEQQHLLTVFRQIPKNVGRKIKYVNISTSIRPEAQRNALYKLQMSRIIKLITHSSALGSPLEHESKDIFKPLFIDIGLLNHLLKIRLIDTDNMMTIHEGALAEQFVGQELLTVPPYFIDRELFYWLRESKNSNAELDYLWEFKNQIIPIEVKSGKVGTLKSLFVYSFEKKKKKGIRFSANIPEIQDIETQIRLKAKNENVNIKLLTLPLYLTYRITDALEEFI
ncbi:MAG: ATP-binding protein [Bacteroidales bacterium]|nr:ATP-binding protein [Bacteroidales bacterium]